MKHSDADRLRDDDPRRHADSPMTDAERARRYRQRHRKTINKRRRTLRKLGANKFNGGSHGKHHWLTPPELFARLDAEFHFTFDPCPYPRPEGFDGLTCEWGESNYVNIPFGSTDQHGRKAGPTAWVRKAIAEYRRGKLVVLVFPLDKWLLALLEAVGAQLRNLGDVRWLAIEDQSPGPGTGRHIAAFVLDPR
jgi:hypothetical protein